MIAIAALAILMSAIRIAVPFLCVKGIWVHTERLSVVVESFDWALESRFTPTPGTPRDDFRVAIPLLQLVITAPWVTLWSLRVIAGLKNAARRRSTEGDRRQQSGESIDRQPGIGPKQGAGGIVG
jgi:hypothetical protein